jgi:diadenylate cyclase
VVRNFRGKKVQGVQRTEIDILIASANAMARDRIGALIVLRGKDPIQRHLDGGTDLDGELSEAVLRSIFDPNSIGHDGAVIIKDNRISQFSSHLPLSKNLKQLRRSGTRHAAALGLAEMTDALCLVVSEEEGTISVARNSDLHQVRDAEELRALLDQFYQETLPKIESRPWSGFFKKNYREKAIALVVTILLWFFFVHEAKVEFQTFTIPVEYNNLSSPLVVERIEPEEVEITFSGPRRAFYLVRANNMKVMLKLFDAREGELRKLITRTNVTFPEGIALENIQPNEIVIKIERTTQDSQ